MLDVLYFSRMLFQKQGLSLWAIALLLSSISFGIAPPNVLIVLTDDRGWGFDDSWKRNLSTLISIRLPSRELLSGIITSIRRPTRAEFLPAGITLEPGSVVSVAVKNESMLTKQPWRIFSNQQAMQRPFGKWHNGTQSLHPNDRGFDEYYGFTSGHWGHYFSPPLDHNGKIVRGDGFVVDDFTNHAIDFMKSNRDRPFLCYVPLNTPHAPMMITDDFYEKFRKLEPQMRHRDPAREDLEMTRAALAMVENIDWNVGRLLATLDELSIADDTVVVYFSDNGPNSYRWNGGMKEEGIARRGV